MDNDDAITRNNIAEAVYQKMQKKILDEEWPKESGCRQSLSLARCLA